MHFVYKLDHLFQSKRVSDENSSVSKAFHFSKLILTRDFCLHSTCNIQSHILKFQTFLTSILVSCMRHNCNQVPKVSICLTCIHCASSPGNLERRTFLCSSIYGWTKVELCRTM